MQEEQPDTSDRLQSFVTKELGKRTPVTMPREYAWAAGAGAIVLILTAWPVLILGIVLGAWGMFKVGCPCPTEKKQDEEESNLERFHNRRTNNHEKL